MIDPAYQGSDAFRLLYESYLTRLLELAKREMYVVEIMADVITEDGLRLAEFVGMKRLRESRHGTFIYKGTLLPPALRVTTHICKQLTGFYKAKYAELKELLELSHADGGAPAE